MISNSKLCNIHQLPLIYGAQHNKEQSLCQACIQQNNDQQSLTYAPLRQMKSKIDGYILNLKQTIQNLDSFKQTLLKGLDQIISTVLSQIGILQKFQISQNNEHIDIDVEYQKITDIHQNQIHQLNEQLIKFKEKLNLEDILNQISLQQSYIKQSQNLTQKYVKLKNKYFTYELINDNQISIPDQICCSFAFNSDNSKLFVGTTKYQIMIFDIVEGIVKKEIQRLSAHNNLVVCLLFMKKFNLLISGSQDRSIKIWSLDQNNQWVLQQKLYEHKSKINCLIINQKEDLLISGSSDKTIKIWTYDQQYIWYCNQTIETNDDNFSLSINDSDSIIAVCGYSKQIQIFSKQNQNQWLRMQVIRVDEYGYRILFLNENQFIFQQRNSKFLELFGYSQDFRQFNKINQLYVESSVEEQSYFPYQYIKQKQIISIKNGQFWNLLYLTTDGEFILQQSIDFKDPRLFGALSHDGEYLVIWNWDRKIEVRKLITLEN